jgi:hypothetical protein
MVPKKQRRQSAKLFLQLPELGLPTPSHAGKCVPPPPPLVPDGGGGGPGPTSEGERSWGVPIERGDRHCGNLGIYHICTLWDDVSLKNVSSERSIWDFDPLDNTSLGCCHVGRCVPWTASFRTTCACRPVGTGLPMLCWDSFM